MNDEFYMKRAIELASLGAGQVSPNPMVGAVIVHENIIIGEGYHKKYGDKHAEVNAIEDVLNKFINAEDLLKNSSIYVTLEPCSHYGKTPPCADLLVKYQLKKVIIGCPDFNEIVKGKGIDKLIKHGIDVQTDILRDECIELNKRFFTSIIKKRPYIILKWAETNNGLFAPFEKKQFWISNLQSKILVHKWRSEEDCVLVGYRTAEIDNPQLNVRLWKGRNPKRAIIDRQLSLPNDYHLLDNTQETFVFNAIKSDINQNTKYYQLEDFDNLLPQYLLYQLYLNDIQSLIIEGGAETINKFIQANLWDEARIFTGKNELNEGINAPKINGHLFSQDNIGNNVLKVYKNL